MATYKKINQLEEAAKRLNTAGAELGNMTYDNFKTGNVYKGLQRDYQQRGQMAMKDTLGQVAARTGGMASSYATSAANQSYNNYMRGLEDAARSLFNDEYSRAKDKYNTARNEYNTAYGEYRDAVEDERYQTKWDYQVRRDQKADNDALKEDEMDMLASDAYYGNVGTYAEYKAKHPNTMISEADFNSIVGAASGKRTDANRKTVDSEFETMFGAEGFKWGDWNKDGNVTDADAAYAPDFSKSSYGEDYWKQFSADAQQDYADADIEAAQEEVYDILEAGGEPPIDLLIKAGWLEEIIPANEGETPNYDSDGNGIPDGLSGLAATMWQNNIDAENEATALEDEAKAEEKKIAAVNDIEARIANGESLEDIKKAYGIVDEFDENDDPQGKNGFTWEEVTGKSLAEWTKKFNDNYSYQDTEAGRAEIVKSLVGSHGMALGTKDQSNFNHLFGNDAYKTVQTYITDVAEINPQNMTAEEFSEAMYNLANSLPTKMTEDDIDEIIKKANPEAYKAITDETYFYKRKPQNTGDFK